MSTSQSFDRPPTGVVIIFEWAAGTVVHGLDKVAPGSFLASWDVDAFGGLGHAGWTTDPAEAHVFASAAAAMRAWQAQSKVRPLRDDGRPNKPLTAATISIVPAP